MSHSSLARLVLVLAIVGVLLLASCSTTPSTPGTSDKPAALTKPNGSLVVTGKVAGMDTMYPTVQGSPNNYQYLSAAVFESLVDVFPDGQLSL